MSIRRPQTVRSSLWPFLTIVWTFTGPSGRVRFERRILYTIIMTVIVILLNMYVIRSQGSSTNKALQLLDYLKIATTLMTLWLWVLKGASAVENSIVQLTKLDEELKNFRLVPNHEGFMWKQLFTICGHALLISLYFVLRDGSHYKHDLTVPNHSWPHLFTIYIHRIQFFQVWMMDLLFAMTIEAFRIRFELVNEIFERIAESEDQIKVKVFATSYFRKQLSRDISGEKLQHWNAKRHISSQLLIERVDRACRIHRRLLKAIQEVRDVFSLQLCVSSPIVISIIVLTALALLSTINANRDYTLLTSANVLSALSVIARCWQIVLSCSNTSDKANDLGTSLYRIPIEDAAVHKQLQEHSVYIVQRKLTFTGGGIFVVDRNFATSVFSTTIKYFLILIQFRDA